MGTRSLESGLAAGRGPLDLAAARPALQGFFARQPGVRVAYLFGSQARSSAGPRSDVDIAVRLARYPSPDEHNAAWATLIAGVSDALQRHDVDLVILNGADPILAYEAVSAGQVLYESEPGAALRDQGQTFKEYVEARELQTRHLRRIRESIRERRGAWAASRS